MEAAVTHNRSPEAKTDVRDSSSSFPQSGARKGAGECSFDDEGRGEPILEDKGTQVLLLVDDDDDCNADSDYPSWDDALVIFDEGAVSVGPDGLCLPRHTYRFIPSCLESSAYV